MFTEIRPNTSRNAGHCGGESARVHTQFGSSGLMTKNIYTVKNELCNCGLESILILKKKTKTILWYI